MDREANPQGVCHMRTKTHLLSTLIVTGGLALAVTIVYQTVKPKVDLTHYDRVQLQRLVDDIVLPDAGHR